MWYASPRRVGLIVLMPTVDYSLGKYKNSGVDRPLKNDWKLPV